MNRYKKFYMNLLGIKFKRVTECRPYSPNANLCATVALSKAIGVSFEDIYEMQIQYGKEKHVLMNSVTHVLDPILTSNGYKKIKKHEIPAGITVGEFMYTHKQGKYVILTKDHIEYYMNGTRYIAPIDSNHVIDLDSWLFYKVAGVWYK